MKRFSLVVAMVVLGGGWLGCNDSGLPAGKSDAAGDGAVSDGGDAGAGPDTAAVGGDAADGASTAPGALTPVRRTSYRRITNFPRGPEARFITGAKISADGKTIIYGTTSGTYTIAADGTKLLQLSSKPSNGLVDLAANGSKVVWYDNDHVGFVAGSDGAGKVMLPAVATVKAVRMTAAGDQIFVTAPDSGGVLKFPADASAMKVVMTTTEVSTLNGVQPNGNHWRGVLDISDDGSKVVFTFLWDAFSMTGEGAGLKQLTQFLMPENRTLNLVRISGSGSKLAWNVEDGEKSAVTISDWDGGNKVVYLGFTYSSGTWLQLPGDGSKAVLGWGIRVLDASKVAPYDAIDSGSNSIPLGRPAMVTMTADHKRAALVIEGQESTDQGRPSQIVVVDFDPATSNGAPSIEGTRASLTQLPNDGSKASTVSAVVTDTEVTEVNTVALRGGLRLGATPWMHWALGDIGMNGDTVAMDSTYSTNALTVNTDFKVTPGPFTLRFVASNKAGHVLMVDTEGLEARSP